MKSFAILSLAAAVIAMPAPEHVVTELVTCTDSGYGAKETVTVTAPCGGEGGNAGGYGGKGNGGYPQAPVTVTVTETKAATVTETVTQGSGSGSGSGNGQYTQTGANNGQSTETGNNGQYTTAAPPPEQTSTSTSTPPNGSDAPVTHSVAVGAFPRASGLPPAFEFRPNNITAKEGDVVRFQMLKKAHSVTQSLFAKPCIKAAPPNMMPFDTELVNNTANATDMFRDFTVPKTSVPLWFYCKQKDMTHCGKGMVFGINPKSDDQVSLSLILPDREDRGC
jgi:plastocyanin